MKINMNSNTNHVLHVETIIKDTTLLYVLTCWVTSHRAENHVNTQGLFSPNYNHSGKYILPICAT